MSLFSRIDGLGRLEGDDWPNGVGWQTTLGRRATLESVSIFARLATRQPFPFFRRYVRTRQHSRFFLLFSLSNGAIEIVRCALKVASVCVESSQRTNRLLAKEVPICCAIDFSTNETIDVCPFNSRRNIGVHHDLDQCSVGLRIGCRCAEKWP